ncbi:MAG: MTH1187 family thiamine-binding protein [Bacteroidia bacterium]|nr:MTH1187 family thiamine-binding protein [Bacteroidia bacterium]
MHVIADFTVVPIGVGLSVSKYIAECERILRDAGLTIQLHAYGTNIEGEWDAVFAAIKRCQEVVHEMGAPRISCMLKYGTRTDREQSMADKVRSVEEKIAAT